MNIPYFRSICLSWALLGLSEGTGSNRFCEKAGCPSNSKPNTLHDKSLFFISNFIDTFVCKCLFFMIVYLRSYKNQGQSNKKNE